MSELLDATDDMLSIPVAQVRSREDFIACLDRARVLAGPLSHREIESRSGRRLRRTKIGQVLAGEFPRRDFLLTYLEVCGVPEADRTEWLRAWAWLLTRSSTMDEPVSAEVTQVLARPTVAPAIAPEVRQLRADLDATLNALRRGQHEKQELERRLVMTESAYADAATQARALRDQLERAQHKINDLTELINWLRTDGPGADEPAAEEQPTPTEEQPADDEETSPPDQHRAPGPPREAKYTVAYTRAEVEDLFGANQKAAPPVVGL
jgi:hypothetical protein